MYIQGPPYDFTQQYKNYLWDRIFISLETHNINHTVISFLLLKSCDNIIY